jgi:hypothetical protein
MTHLAAIILVFAQIAGAPAKVKTCKEREEADKKEKTKYEVIIGPDGKRIYKLKTDFVLCGKVPKPDVMYGLLNSTINYEWESLKQDFLPRVLEVVEHSPF